MSKRCRILAIILAAAVLISFGQYAIRRFLYYQDIEPNIVGGLNGFYYEFAILQQNISSYIEADEADKERTLDFVTKNVVRCQANYGLISSSVYTIGAAEKKYGFSQDWDRYLTPESEINECFRIFLGFLDRCRNKPMASKEEAQLKIYLSEALKIFQEWEDHFSKYDFHKCQTSKEYAIMYREMMVDGELLFVDRFKSFLNYYK